MTAAPPRRLPDDVVHLILLHLDDPLHVARCEIVCRQWHAVARSSARLWRDALCVEGDCVPETGIFHKRIKALSRRSGGRLDRVAMRLTGSETGSGTTGTLVANKLLKMLPSLRANTVFIECANTRLFQRRIGQHKGEIVKLEPRGGYCTFAKDNLLDKVLTAASQCTSIRQLHIQAPQAKLGFQRSFVGQPIARNHLTRIYLQCAQATALFDDDSLFDMLRYARSITLLFMHVAVPRRHAWRLLQQASQTLEHFDVTVELLDSQPMPSAVLQQPITLPHLTSLCFRGTHNIPYNINRSSQQHDAGGLVCPALRHLTWLHDDHDSMLPSLLGEQLELLTLFLRCTAPASCTALEAVTSFTAFYAQELQRFMSLLQAHCVNLRQLTIRTFGSKYTTAFLVHLANLPVQRFAFVDESRKQPLLTSQVIELVQLRQAIMADRDGVLPIISIRVAPSHDFTEDDIAWLQKHVDDVDVLPFRGAFGSLESLYAWQRTDASSHPDSMPSLLDRRSSSMSL